MSATVSVAGPYPGQVIANTRRTFVATVTNTGSSSAQLTVLQVTSTRRDVRIGQPSFLQAGQPANAGFPTLAASGSGSYGFDIVVNAPNTPGPNPSNPGGAAPSSAATELRQENVELTVTAILSDGSSASALLTVPVLSAVAPWPKTPETGALEFVQGGNSNLIAVIA